MKPDEGLHADHLPLLRQVPGWELRSMPLGQIERFRWLRLQKIRGTL
jgi:hypothetical protein